MAVLGVLICPGLIRPGLLICFDLSGVGSDLIRSVRGCSGYGVLGGVGCGDGE